MTFRPYLFFSGNCRQAFTRYQEIFGGDLTDAGVRTEVGLGLEVLTGPDWATCQDLGATAHALGVQALRSPSAAGVDDVLAVFVQHIGLGTVEPKLVEEWHTLADLEMH
jgi:RES domain-containing protein